MKQVIALVHKYMKTIISTPFYIFKQIEERWSTLSGDIEDFERFRSRLLFLSKIGFTLHLKKKKKKNGESV